MIHERGDGLPPPLPPAGDGRAFDLRDPLTAAYGRVQLLRRRLRRGALDGAMVEAGLTAVEADLARLAAAVMRLERASPGPGAPPGEG